MLSSRAHCLEFSLPKSHPVPSCALSSQPLDCISCDICSLCSLCSLINVTWGPTTSQNREDPQAGPQGEEPSTTCDCNGKTWVNDIMLLQRGCMAALVLGHFPFQGSASPMTSFLPFLLYDPFRGSSTEKKATPWLSCSLCGPSVGENALPFFSWLRLIWQMQWAPSICPEAGRRWRWYNMQPAGWHRGRYALCRHTL